ncbi:hypothetical protein EGW08_000085 [Elysia chlorotica]|uniref:PDZ domain-containing protein n=1 Tax=Elysia chlorotica TaxID=188477 RepID=A0A3S1I4U8_ELYCH|nr:hypothetical protein EGW08_000085 [Elysia chlorotica]
MALVRSRSSDIPQHRSVSTSTRQLQEALYTHLDDLEKSAFIDALSAYGAHRDIFELVNALRKILNTPVKRNLFPLVKKIIRPGDSKAFDLLTKADKQSGTLPRPHLYRPHIADINVLNKHRASSLPDISRGTRVAPPTGEPRAALPSRYRPSPNRRGAWSGGEEEAEPRNDRQAWGLVADKHKTHSTRPKNSSDEIDGEVFEIDIGEPSLAGEGFGFTIRGGVEHEMGVYVSSVDHGSTAYKNGLTVGDLLLEVNNISFRGIPHQEAVKIIKAATRLQLVVSRVGRIPGSHTVLESFRWTDPKGRPVSPPPEGSGGVAGEDDGRGRSGTRMLQGSDERKINIMVQKGQGLGLMIRGGNEYGLGIFVSGIDPCSVAENAGIKLGDQIIDVNGRSFLDISHSQAVSHLKKGRHLIMTVRDIGKIPFAKTVIDEKGWIESTRVNSYSKSGSTRSLSGSVTDQDTDWKIQLRQKNSPWSQNREDRKENQGQISLDGGQSRNGERVVIHDQAKIWLNPSEHATLNYYLGEYDKQTIGIQGLTQAMLELLNTPAKLTLLSDLRSAIRGKDLDMYDKAITAREKQVSLASARKQLAPDTLSLASYDSADIRLRDKYKQTMFSKPVARKQLAPDTLSLASYDSADIRLRDKYKQTMFSKPATLTKAPTAMEPLDFNLDTRRSSGQHAPYFTLSDASHDYTDMSSGKTRDRQKLKLTSRTKGRRLSRSTPDLSKADVEDLGTGPPVLRQQIRHRTRPSRSRSKSPGAGLRTLSRRKSEEPSDDSGVEITGHLGQHTRAQESDPREVTNGRNRHHHHQQQQQQQQQQQYITHQQKQQQQTTNNSNRNSSNNINSSYHHHRRERQRPAHRQEDSTTTDEDVATQTTTHRSRLHTLTPRGRNRSVSRDSSSRIKPRSRSTSSSRQPGSTPRGEAQERVFLTVPVEYPLQTESDRGRTPRRYGFPRENTSAFERRSSSSSVSPKHQYSVSSHQYQSLQQQQQKQQQQQQQQSRSREGKTNRRAPQRQDSYNTDTSASESTIGKYDRSESSARTSSTLTINGKKVSTSVSPKLFNTMVIEDTLMSSPSNWNNHQGNTTKQSEQGSCEQDNAGDTKGQPNLQNDTHQRRRLLSQPKRIPLYLSPKRGPPEKDISKDYERTGKRASVDEARNLKRESVDSKTTSNFGEHTASSKKSLPSGNIPLIQINSKTLPRAASEASNKSKPKTRCQGNQFGLMGTRAGDTRFNPSGCGRGRGSSGVEHLLPAQEVYGLSPGDFAPNWLGRCQSNVVASDISHGIPALSRSCLAAR